MRLLHVLKKSGLSYETCRSLADSSHEFSFSICEADVSLALEWLRPECERIGIDEFSVETNLNKVSLVAREMNSQREVEAIRTLTRSGVQIRAVSGTLQRISFLVPAESRSLAVDLLHTNMCR
jgi:aspartokinase